MKSLSNVWLLLGIVTIGSAAPLSAAAEAWLPHDTLGVVRVPNAAATQAQYAVHPWRQLWLHPAMEPFREQLRARLGQEGFLSPQDRPGLRLSDAVDLARGELLLALLPPERGPLTLDRLQFLLLADVADQAECVHQLLAPAPEAEAEPGPDAVRALPIRGVGFHPADVRWPPGPLSGTDAGGSTRTPCWAGLTGSWLILGNNTNQLAALLKRMQDGAADRTPRAPQFPYAGTGSSPESSLHGWLDLRPMLGILLAMADAADQERAPDDEVPMPKWREMLEATGFTDLRSIGCQVHDSPAGTRLEVNLTAPAATRRGLLEMLALERLDASPPPDVAADVVRFERIRLDFNQGWRTLERMLTGLFPQLSGVLDLLFQAAGPGGEPGDLRDTLLPVLGNDIVRYELAPRTTSLAAWVNPPSLIRLQSTNPPQLALSLRALTVLLPPPMNELSEETISGREIWSIPLPRLSVFGTGSAPARPVRFTALNDAVVFTSDRPLLTALLTPNTPGQSALRDRPDLGAAAAQVGGMGQGLFGYHDLAQSMRTTFGVLRQDSQAWQQLLSLSPIAPPPQSPVGRLLQKLDFRLLPPFDEVSGHFHFVVHAAGTDTDRFYYRLFIPRPPR